MENLDQISINFNADNLFWINTILSIVMFSVALEIKWSDFKVVFQKPKMILAGVLSQYLLLPLITIILIYLIPLHPSIALGLIMVSVCPGGNVSNFFTLLAKGNTALSICLTSIATVVSGFMIPFGFYFGGHLSNKTAPLMNEVSVDYFGILKLAFFLLVVPLISGMLMSKYLPGFSKRISGFLQKFSIGIFALLILGAFFTNIDTFLQLFHIIFWTVLIHNGLALLGGYNLARIFGLGQKERRTIAIETGIQNSGIGLVIIFNFFPHLGGMAIIVAWWGIWHLISGLSMGFIFNKLDQKGHPKSSEV